MSRRYGRNQKRKARQALEAANAETARLQAEHRLIVGREKRAGSLLAEAHEKLYYINEILRDAPYSGVLPGQTFLETVDPKMTWPDYHGYRRITERKMDFFPIEPYPFMGPMIESEAVFNMNRLRYAVERDITFFQTRVHFWIEGNHTFDGRWQYFISDDALRNGIPPCAKQSFCTHIARELMLKIGRDMRERSDARKAVAE